MSTKLRKILAVTGVVVSFCPLFFGVGYLFLRRWIRGTVAILLQTVGVALVRDSLGPECMLVMLVITWLVVMADAFRLARAEWRQSSPEPA